MPWKKIDSREIYNNPWIELSHHDVITPAGTEGIYGVVHFKHLAVGVIPLDDKNHTWLVKQHRYPLACESWEIPEGGCPIDEQPLQAAKRELAEETGLGAELFTEFLTLHLSNSVTDEKAVVYLAEGLTLGEQHTEDTEKDLTVKRVSLEEAVSMALDGRITDAISVAALLRLALDREITICKKTT